MVVGCGCAGHFEYVVIVSCSEFNPIENSYEFSHPYCSRAVGVVVYCSNLMEIDFPCG